MRSEQEIIAVRDKMLSRHPLQIPGGNNNGGDNFQFGFHEGKIEGLTWVLGLIEGGEFSIDYDREGIKEAEKERLMGTLAKRGWRFKPASE